MAKNGGCVPLCRSWERELIGWGSWGCFSIHSHLPICEVNPPALRNPGPLHSYTWNTSDMMTVGISTPPWSQPMLAWNLLLSSFFNRPIHSVVAKLWVSGYQSSGWCKQMVAFCDCHFFKLVRWDTFTANAFRWSSWVSWHCNDNPLCRAGRPPTANVLSLWVVEKTGNHPHQDGDRQPSPSFNYFMETEAKTYEAWGFPSRGFGIQYGQVWAAYLETPSGDSVR